MVPAAYVAGDGGSDGRRSTSSAYARPAREVMVECDVLGCGKEADPGYGVAFQNRCRGHSGKPSDLCAQQLVALRGALRDAMAFVDPATARDFHLWKDLLDV
jgi:hypothetical protein